jgi:hypothetical protein
MGAQKAIVAFVMASVGLANTLFAVDFNIDANLVTTLVGVGITVLTTFGVWKVSNTTPEPTE